jgi:hypothetical protein
LVELEVLKDRGTESEQILNWRHSLQQQKRIKRQTRAPPIMAVGVVKVQWLMGFSLASFVMVSSSWSRILESNLPEILVQSCRWLR